MGLTVQSVGSNACAKLYRKTENKHIITLVGNPNTGKSTVFNELTGLKQHTGNWSGKTVTNAEGEFKHRDKNFTIIDLPGMYSVNPTSLDEKWAMDFMCSDDSELIVVVLDGSCLERNLILALQVINICENVIICVNLLDEAKRKNIIIDLEKLSLLLDVPIVGTSARNKIGLEELKEEIYNNIEKINKSNVNTKKESKFNDIDEVVKQAEYIYSQTVVCNSSPENDIDRKIDNIIMSKKYGIPIMLIMLGVIFWITIVGANYPSNLLSRFFNNIEIFLLDLCTQYNVPFWAKGVFIEGMFRTLSWVVSVMLPPMAIFFPLFTLLEDIGILPRIAFNLDHFFKKAKAHGKQALTMCMGFGCNAAGIVACRIIDSPRERLIAIITNNFVPCNGRFPTIIALATIFIAGVGGMFTSFKVALIVLLSIVLSVIITLTVSRILSNTILKGMPSSFVLELPPYRKPQYGKIVIRSIFDRTLFVVGRAIVVAAPAGIAIWLMQNIDIGGQSILMYISNFLNPFAQLIGLDGFILTAFILGLPANEIVIPLIIMFYTFGGSLVNIDNLSDLGKLLIANGWTFKTAICTMLFSLNHFPCSTTIMTIKKETGSLKWTIISFLVPTITGIIVCFIANNILGIFVN